MLKRIWLGLAIALFVIVAAPNGSAVSGRDVIVTVAGNGKKGFSGDGGPATRAKLNAPHGLAFDPHGNLYIADHFGSRVRKVDTDGTMTTVAGGGSSYANGPALERTLGRPIGLTLDRDGNLYVADGVGHVVRKVTPGGRMTTIAGIANKAGHSGDGGPATRALMSVPEDVAIDAGGNIYVSDAANNVIRRIDKHGTITRVAGTGTQGHSGDGGPATRARLGFPGGMAFDRSGNLYVAEFGGGGPRSKPFPGHSVRRIAPDGTITTVAGTGQPGFSGDGGPANKARMYRPTDVAVGPDGSLYIVDHENFRVRKVGLDGTISTVAGTGKRKRPLGDNGPAARAWLNDPASVAVDRDGSLFVSTALGGRVRKIKNG